MLGYSINQLDSFWSFNLNSCQTRQKRLNLQLFIRKIECYVLSTMFFKETSVNTGFQLFFCLASESLISIREG